MEIRDKIKGGDAVIDRKRWGTLCDLYFYVEETEQTDPFPLLFLCVQILTRGQEHL